MHNPARCLTQLYQGCLILSVQVDHASELRQEESANPPDGHDGWEHDAYLIVPQPDPAQPHALLPIGRYKSLGEAFAGCRSARQAAPAAPVATKDILDQPLSAIDGQVRLETLL